MMTHPISYSFRLMTYNLGGGRGNIDSDLEAILEVINSEQPDILVAQEATDYQDADGVWSSVHQQIAQRCGFGENYYFGPTLTLKEHMHVRRAILVDSLYNDLLDWRHGNAIFCRWGFVRLGDSSKVGHPRSVPVYDPPRYEGTRDTDPRHALLARINRAPLFPFVVGVHLTTMLGERGKSALPDRVEQAQILRFQQTRRLLDLVRKQLLEREELVFLLGDFNARSNEPSIANMLMGEGGFVRLVPKGGSIPTHPPVPDAVDHIFVYPAKHKIRYECRIVDTDLSRSASDHLPVVAEIEVSCEEIK